MSLLAVSRGLIDKISLQAANMLFQDRDSLPFLDLDFDLFVLIADFSCVVTEVAELNVANGRGNMSSFVVGIGWVLSSVCINERFLVSSVPMSFSCVASDMRCSLIVVVNVLFLPMQGAFDFGGVCFTVI